MQNGNRWCQLQSPGIAACVGCAENEELVKARVEVSEG